MISFFLITLPKVEWIELDCPEYILGYIVPCGFSKEVLKLLHSIFQEILSMQSEKNLNSMTFSSPKSQMN